MAHSTIYDTASQQTEYALPVSFMQEGLWFLKQVEPESAAYNIPIALRLNGQLDEQALQESIDAIVQRHEVLRSSFRMIEGQLKQVITPTQVHLLNVDLQHFPPAEQDVRVQRTATQEVQRPFDLAQGPLLRVTLLRLGTEEHLLLITMHHIISDGSSMMIFCQELYRHYKAFSAAQPLHLPELPIQYADFALWQHEHLQEGALAERLAYWKKQLAGMPEGLLLSSDRPRPAIPSSRGARFHVKLPEALAQGLKKLSRQEGVTLYVTLVAAFQCLLHRYSGQDDIVLGTTSGGRTQAETEELIGMFVNTLVLRCDLSGNPTFRELLGRVRRVVLDAQKHQDIPFDLLVKELHPERQAGQNPLFQVLLTLDPSQPVLSEEWTLTQMEIGSGTAKFDLTLELHDQQEGLMAHFEYRTDLFEETTIARMAGHWQMLLESIVAHPERRLAELALLTQPERHRLLVEWNDTEAEYPEDSCIHQLFEAQVKLTPDAVAVVFERQRLSYRYLNRRANQLARHLQSLGVGPESLVGVCMERSVEMVVALMSVLKAGGAYVPLDPTYPQDRLEYMIQDAQLPVLLTQHSLVARLPETKGTQLIALDSDFSWQDTREKWDVNIESLVKPENVAYMIYTSGSTGKPKGVMNIHRGLLNRLWWMQQRYQLTAKDRVMQKTPFSFDVSVWEFFWPLMSGARLVVARPGGHQDPVYLATLIEEQQITTLHFVPSMLQAFLMEPRLQPCESLKRVLCSGEALPFELQKRFFARFVHSELHNLYGPTEAAIDVSSWQCVPGSQDWTVPIGYPIANTQLYILDRAMQPMPIGVVGELYIGGVNVARGYYRRPELTSEKFLPDPFRDETGMRLFKTGDLARYRENGAIEFLGRIDYQVKIRGLRIELGEIEAVLSQHPEVKDVVVLAREDSPGDKRLVAYIVHTIQPLAPTEPGEEIRTFVFQLRDLLKEQLPSYMMPSSFKLLEALPLTPNGKLDRRALPPPDSSRDSTEETYIVPTQMVHYQLIAIWEELLNVHPIGIQDNFFYLGGHSLLAIQLLERIERVFHQKLELTTLFVGPTIEQLAVALQGQEESDSQLPIKAIHIQDGKAKLPFFFLHGNWNGDGFYCYPLARGMGREQPFYALPPYPLDGLRRPPGLEEMAAAYIVALRMEQPEGPYMLGGWCNGALVAYEMARQLQMQGQTVDTLILVHPTELVSSLLLRWTRNAICSLGQLLHLRQEVQLDCFLRTYHINNYLRNAIYRKVEFERLHAASQVKRAVRGKASGWLLSQLNVLFPAIELLRTYEPIFIWSAMSYAPTSLYTGNTTFIWPHGESYVKAAWQQVAESTEAQMYVLPGTHETLLNEHLSELAEQLRSCIESVQKDYVFSHPGM